MKKPNDPAAAIPPVNAAPGQSEAKKDKPEITQDPIDFLREFGFETLLNVEGDQQNACLPQSLGLIYGLGSRVSKPPPSLEVPNNVVVSPEPSFGGLVPPDNSAGEPSFGPTIKYPKQAVQ